MFECAIALIPLADTLAIIGKFLSWSVDTSFLLAGTQYMSQSWLWQVISGVPYSGLFSGGANFSLFSWLTHKAWNFPPTKFSTQHVAGAKIILWSKIMVPFHYLRPVDSTLDPHGPLPSAVPHPRSIIGPAPRKLEPRKLILTTLSSIPRKFPPTNITRYMVAIFWAEGVWNTVYECLLYIVLWQV